MGAKETDCKRPRPATELRSGSVDPEARTMTKWSKVQPQRTRGGNRSGTSSKRKRLEDETIERILKKAKGHGENRRIEDEENEEAPTPKQMARGNMRQPNVAGTRDQGPAATAAACTLGTHSIGSLLTSEDNEEHLT